jgi:hypothetical protein
MNIDTYEKLKVRLLDQYGRKKKTGLEVVCEIERIRPNWKKTTLKEFFTGVEELLYSTTIEVGFMIRSINEKLPIAVKD